METLNDILRAADGLRGRLSSLRPLPADALRKIDDAFAIEYTYESNRIEGNTLTLQETELVVNEGVTVAGKSMREHLEAINHTQAIEYIKDIARKDVDICERIIKDIHGIVLHGIDRANAGRYRTVPVMISGSVHVPPQPYMIADDMERFMAAYGTLSRTEHPITVAAYLHDELVRIHPFIDGNGRTARLLMNLYLLRYGYTIVALKGSDSAKIEYYEALERSHVHGDPSAFRLLVARAEVDALRRYLSIVDVKEQGGEIWNRN